MVLMPWFGQGGPAHPEVDDGSASNYSPLVPHSRGEAMGDEGGGQSQKGEKGKSRWKETLIYKGNRKSPVLLR